MTHRRAVFFDRDGVLVEDRGVPTRADPLVLLPGAPRATALAHDAGFEVIVVTNQAVVARGLLTEPAVDALHAAMGEALRRDGGHLDAVYVCPHHPDADVEGYRVECECRKPRPGLLRRAATERGIDLARSYVVGDRMTDVEAGRRAGCRTVLVRSGAHAAPRIVTSEPEDASPPDAVVDDVVAAVTWIVGS